MANIYLGIDPGIAHTGLCALTKNEIIQATTIHTVKDKSCGQTEDVYIRCTQIVDTIDEFLETQQASGHKIIGCAIETFTDQGATRKQFKDRWKTPFLIGYLSSKLEDKSFHVIFQDNSLIRDDGLDITLSSLKHSNFLDRQPSDHARDAARHALYLAYSV